MSDNEFNNNGGKDPWDINRDSSPPNEQQSELKGAPNKDEDTAGRSEQGESNTEPGGESAGDRDVSSSEPSAEQPSQPYQNPQTPYSPYGQYNNPYGSYQNPYGNYNNPYGTYGQNQYNQPPQQQQQQQYWNYQQYGGQYQQQNPQQPKPPKKKNTGLHVFLWILGVLVVGFALGFSVLGFQTAMDQKQGSSEITASQPSENESTASSASSKAQVEGGIQGNGTNPGSAGITVQQQPSGDELNAKNVYKKVVESVVGVETTVAGAIEAQGGVIQGTGIVATSDGYILTNAHVVNYSRANKVKVILHNKKEYEATVVGYDKTSDIAVLKIKATNLTAAVFGNADQLEIGDSVIAIGNPGGMSYSSSLTGGYVSALNRTIESHSDNGMTYIQTDAAINPGNSGGPLVNMYGQVVGINSNKIVETGYEGMGFAIPISKAKTIIDDLVSRGYVTGRSRLGISAIPITEAQSQISGYPVGVIIKAIGADSDLKNSKVVVGDIITKADGQNIASLEDLYAVMNKHKAGETITLTIFSTSADQVGSTRQVKTKLLEDKGETQTR
jgi:serine protease Do